jgi:aryl-alcohol dehydrogenase-like predicted oxidoreductase
MLGTLNVSAIALGAPIYEKTNDEEISQLLARAFELGIDLIDTSDAYQDGEHEKVLGRALKGRRSKAILATKFGNIRGKDGKPSVDGRPQYVAEACERSLRHLGVDVIDLTMSTASIRMFLSKKPSARWSDLRNRGRFGISAFPKPHP